MENELEQLRRLLSKSPASSHPARDVRGEILELKNELCERIRAGQADHDPWRREVMAHVRQTLIKKLKIANPRMIERAQEKF